MRPCSNAKWQSDGRSKQRSGAQGLRIRSRRNGRLTEKWRQYTCTPIRYFSTRDTEEKKYAAFDEATGLPTRRATGEALGEKEQKKLAKELARYAKVHEEFVAKGGEGWLAEQEKELASLCQALESL
ncbi:hypothetical protein TcYC6_0061240 [Trypanosoma cruzi]|nr:hypothetical protein TcYC6_0061240 [Trypanosoma cruzi]